MPQFWTADQEAQLRAKWETGASASEIAAELGSVTKNAVIGKAHRLNLARRAPGPKAKAAHSPARKHLQAPAIASRPSPFPDAHLPLPYVDLVGINARLHPAEPTTRTAAPQAEPAIAERRDDLTNKVSELCFAIMARDWGAVDEVFSRIRQILDRRPASTGDSDIDAQLGEIRSAFDGVDIATKNVALRKAHRLINSLLQSGASQGAIAKAVADERAEIRHLAAFVPFTPVSDGKPADMKASEAAYYMASKIVAAIEARSDQKAP